MLGGWLSGLAKLTFETTNSLISGEMTTIKVAIDKNQDS